MKAVRLTVDQRAHFDAEGYLVVRKALSSSEVAHLASACNAVLERRQEADYINTNAGNERRAEVAEDPAFLDLVACNATVPLVVQLLSPNIHLHTAAVIAKRPQAADTHSERQRSWHRDIGMAEDMGHAHLIRAGIKVCYCLVDFHEPQSGQTLLAPRSHLLPTPLPLPRGGVDPVNATELMLRKGDAFLFENRLFHTAAPNLSARTSTVIIFGYSYRWVGGTADDPALINTPLLFNHALRDGLDPIRHQLLCGATEAQQGRGGGAQTALGQWAEDSGLAPPPFEWTMEASSNTESCGSKL